MPPRTMALLFVLLPAVCSTAGAKGETVKLHALFTDNMVIQRDAPIVVRGTGTPGASVSVSVGGRRGAARTGADGRWEAALDPLPAGGPHTITVTGEGASIRLRNILVGDVWVCAGQSNMAWSFGGIGARIKAAGTASPAAREYDRQVAAADRPRIRLYRLPVQGSPKPLDDFVRVEDNPWFPCCRWVVCTPRYAEHYSNVAYHFARALQESNGVPVGLVLNAPGGIPIAPYISRPTLEADADFRPILEKDAAEKNDAREENWEKDRETWRWLRERNAPAFYRDAGISRAAAGWAEPDLDVSGWLDAKLPGSWIGTTGSRGALWLRRETEIPAGWAGRPVRLDLGQGADDQTVFWNGRRIGATPRRTPDFIPDYRPYDVPGRMVAAGRTAIAVRLFDYGGGGSLAEPFMLACGGERLPLAGSWKLRVEKRLPLAGLRPWTVGESYRSAFRPAAAFNAVVAPMAGLPVAGVIWYQGEADIAERSLLYRKLLPAMIADWRRTLGREVPFLFVQLANCGKVAVEPGESRWAELRESQALALRLPKTGMAVAIDVGDYDVHPPNKKAVGERLALAARAVAFGEPVVHSGPVFAGMATEGDRIRVRFTDAGGALATNDGLPPRRFTVAGADRRFVWADAVIEGESVVVRSGRVPRPEAVRYAWADNPEGCNLCGATGLPAVPFRTDGPK